MIASELVSTTVLLLTGLIAGIRHGIDWDHIAAISDITSTQNNVSKGVFMSFLYGLGHAGVVSIIAIGFLSASFVLPQGIDIFMERMVGATLIILGTYVFYSLHKKKGKNFRMLPRWALVANLVLNSYSWTKAKLTRTPRKHHHVLKDGYGNRASYMVGMIHGIGAETPSQMMFFSMALTAGTTHRTELGIIIIMLFSLGLVITNTVMGVLGAYGYIKSSGRQRLYRFAAIITGSFSIIIGILFLTEGISHLPDLEVLIGG